MRVRTGGFEGAAWIGVEGRNRASRCDLCFGFVVMQRDFTGRLDEGHRRLENFSGTYFN